MLSVIDYKHVFRAGVVLLLLGCSSLAYADRRGYVWTYEYMTMPEGASELEYYLTTKVPDLHKYDNRNTWEHQVEYEYGLTDWWDVAVYLEYTGTKVRTRYRFGEKGMYPLDVLLYLEYIRPDDSDSPEVLEGKLILAKDFGRVNLAYNQIVEDGISNGGETEHACAAGVNYEFNPTWKLGVESTGNLTEEKYYLGPTVSWAHEKFWVALGALRGLNDRSDDLRVRLIAGLPF
ncbi:MAG: hypothetical protein ACYTAO_17300 [Planctomycetota bacterium]|jgi:hypothetical protein